MPSTVYGLQAGSSRQDGRTQQAGRSSAAGSTGEKRERTSSSFRTNSTVQYFQKIIFSANILVFFIVENEVFRFYGFTERSGFTVSLLSGKRPRFFK